MVPTLTVTPTQFVQLVKQFIERGDETPRHVAMEIRRSQERSEGQQAVADSFWFAVFAQL